MRYLLFLIILSAFMSCKKQEVSTYEGKEGISFFAYTWENYHLTTVKNYSFAFSLTPVARDTIYLTMRVTGKIADHPRTVLLRAAEGTTATAGVDYELKEAIIPAGAYKFDYPVIVINSPGMLTNTYRLVLEPAETKDFILGTLGLTPATANGYTEQNFRYYKIDLTNQLLQPNSWQTGLFGVFSAVKYRFMLQVTGLTDFSIEAIGNDGVYNLPVKLNNALSEYEAVNGPLIDENGLRVSF